jgi:hypothetical protein
VLPQLFGVHAVDVAHVSARRSLEWIVERTDLDSRPAQIAGRDVLPRRRHGSPRRHRSQKSVRVA